ncbi:DUF1223 domain-containing protein [Noviherbaspirillum saxi]|nr:DUF1223 domain-containing protein [Noviherbaspirillum saxi]
MSRLVLLLPLTASCLLAAGAAQAAMSCRAESPAHTVALLELYTSEGCNSCPPADRFVSNLGSMGRDKLVPLSLHVDYWDYIGWKDVYAKPAFTERQRWLTGLAGSRTVYTPQIFVGGAEQRGWRGGVSNQVRRTNAQPAQARISMTIGRVSANTLPLVIDAQAPRDSKLFVALYENGLTSEVKAGENRGVTLKHDYVVRDWIGPLAINAEGRLAMPRMPVIPDGAVPAKLGIAAFVQDARGTVLQVLAADLCL